MRANLANDMLVNAVFERLTAIAKGEEIVEDTPAEAAEADDDVADETPSDTVEAGAEEDSELT
jgi:hypothetical protein